MNHLELAFRKRRPARSLLTMMGVALAVGSFITLYGLSRSVQANVQQSLEERGTDLTVRRRGIAEPFGGTIPETIIAEIAKIPGIAAVSGQLLSFAATDNDDHVIAFGWASDSFYWREAPLLEGRLPRAGERKVALMGKDIARTLDKHISDDITLLEGRVLIYIHKEKTLDAVAERYPARHYAMIDDKLRILAAMKKTRQDRLTTIFLRQGHYALDPGNIAAYPPTDITVERIGDLVSAESPHAAGNTVADRAQQEES